MVFVSKGIALLRIFNAEIQHVHELEDSVSQMLMFPKLICAFDMVAFEEVFTGGIGQADSEMYTEEQGLSVGDSQRSQVYK